ncbi:hypothetical protein HY478_00010 [Candidatus Uhrbacteria bacterium]|nr:hypothetical protein [Candidatus Uhrbacteria bacterium]
MWYDRDITMGDFFATLLGILLLIGVILSVPLSTHFMNRSAEQMEHFARWRFLGIFTLLVGVGFAILAFVLLSRVLR